VYIKRLIKNIVNYAYSEPTINAKEIKIGKNVKFGKNIIIEGFKGTQIEYIEIGDNCVFEDNVRILAGNVIIGKGNTFHNFVTLLGNGECNIGNYNWFGQYTTLDCTGRLLIGDRNGIGYNCAIWTHFARPTSTLINGGINPVSALEKVSTTIIGNYCGFPGGNIHVSPGIRVADYTMTFANSVLTKDTTNYGVYRGNPAKLCSYLQDINGALKKTFTEKRPI
jgi:acetyltransferase-like isoleucine patch superfamily enzyme